MPRWRRCRVLSPQYSCAFQRPSLKVMGLPLPSGFFQTINLLATRTIEQQSPIMLSLPVCTALVPAKSLTCPSQKLLFPRFDRLWFILWFLFLHTTTNSQVDPRHMRQSKVQDSFTCLASRTQQRFVARDHIGLILLQPTPSQVCQVFSVFLPGFSAYPFPISSHSDSPLHASWLNSRSLALPAL